MRKIKYALVALIVLSGILFLMKPKHEKNALLFPNDLIFTVDEGNRIVRPEQRDVTLFASYLPTSELSTPLYRCIYDEMVKTYIALPIGHNIEEIARVLNLGERKSTSLKGESMTYYFGRNTIEKKESQILVLETHGNLILMLSVNQSEKNDYPSVESLITRYQSNK